MNPPKLSTVQRLIQGTPASSPTTKPETTPASAPAAEVQEATLERKSYCILRGRLDLPEMLELLDRGGERRLFDYASITGVNMSHPGELVLHYEGRECYTITLTGQSLDAELLAGIKGKRVLWVRELDALVAAAIRREESAEPVVTSIAIKQGMVSREWTRGGGSQLRP
jgi:hypothetical protein